MPLSTPRLEIDIEDRAGNIIGEGPLMNVPYVRYGRELGAAGSFETLLPLRDERTSLIEEKAHVLRFRWNGDVVFVGVVESTGATVTNGNALMMPVSGRCLGAELSEAKIGFLELTNGSGAGVTDGPQDILTAADTFTPSTWTLDTTDGYSTTSTAVYAKFAGESALQALRKVANKIGEHWRFHDTDRKIVWMRTDTPDSEIRLIQGAPDLIAAESNPLIAFYDSFSEEKDCAGLFNRIYPYGGGAFEIAVTLNSTTRTAASGFTLSAANNYLQNDTSISDIGITIPLYMQFPDIRPVSNTDADIVSAANALFDAAETALIRNDSVSDFRVFKLGNVVKLPSDVVCGSTVRLVYEDERYNVDADFIVLAIDTHIAQDASVSHRLTVATVDAMPSSGTESIVNSMEDGRVFQTHPILNVNSYETGEKETVFHNGTDEERGYIYFDFDEEVSTIQQVVLKFQTNGDDGGGNIQMLPLESTVTSVADASNTTGAGGSSAPTSGASSTSSSGSSSSSTTSGGSSHTHTIPGHTHTILLTSSGAGVTYQLGFGGAGTAGGLVFDSGAGSNINYPTDSGTGGTTSASESAHTHGMDHTHNIDHTHIVTIGDHTHSVTPDITPSYGLFREDQTNTFYMADLRYRVQNLAKSTTTPDAGGTWYNLDADAVILSGNRYSLDLTSIVYDSDFRPKQTANTLEIARKSTGTYGTRKSCTIAGKLKIRNIIQSTAVS